MGVYCFEMLLWGNRLMRRVTTFHTSNMCEAWQMRCDCLVSVLQPWRSQPPNQTHAPSAGGHKMQICFTLIPAHCSFNLTEWHQSYTWGPLIESEAVVDSSEKGRWGHWWQATVWIRDKIYCHNECHCLGLWCNVRVTSLTNTFDKACACVWARWLQKLY